MFNAHASHALLVNRPRPQRLKFSWIKNSWTRGQSRNSRKYYATKIWSYTVVMFIHWHEWSGVSAAAALCGRSDKKLTSVQSMCQIYSARLPKLIVMFVLFLSQGFCTIEAENIAIFLCGATTANVCKWLWPFCKLPVTTGKSTSPSQSGPECLVN